MKKAIIYVRTNALTELNTEVFTANGIEQQLKELKAYCLNRNIKVKRIFIENYVGKSTEQPEPMKLIHFIESEESKIDSILFTTWDSTPSTEFNREIITMVKRKKK